MAGLPEGTQILIAPSRSWRRWIAAGMAILLVLSLSTWYFMRPSLPREIVFAAAAKHGWYAKFATMLGEEITRKTGRPVMILETSGSIENQQLLREGKANLAIVQQGTVPMEKLATLAPLFPEAACVVARRGRNISGIRDLENKNVVLGGASSGMRSSALEILQHYRVNVDSLKQTEKYFDQLLDDESLDAAIVTTAITNPDLHKVLATGKFDLLPVLDAEALAVHCPCFTTYTIPRGLFSEGPPVPPEPIQTVATTALLAVRQDASSLLVTKAMESLYQSDLSANCSILINQKRAESWPLAHIHPAARDYYDPYEGLNILSDFMQSLAAFKEMLFALGAGLYLLWDRSRRLREDESKKEMHRQKEHLDEFLNETVRIERAQMATNDPVKLREYLDQVTHVKLKALEELTDEDLRGDRMFSIFLMQCANLISKIQSKILLQSNIANAQQLLIADQPDNRE